FSTSWHRTNELPCQESISISRYRQARLFPLLQEITMDVKQQADQGMAKVAELVKEIKFAMLTTQCPDGSLHSRPMSTLQMDEDGHLWFFTSQQSTKIADIDEHCEVNLAYSRTDKQDYLSVSGTAQVIRDRAKMEALWTPWL